MTILFKGENAISIPYPRKRLALTLALVMIVLVACGEPPESLHDFPVDIAISPIHTTNVGVKSAGFLEVVRAKDVIERSPSECNEKYPALPLRVLSDEDRDAQELLAAHPRALAWKRGDRLDGLIVPPDNPLYSSKWEQRLSEHLPQDKRNVPLAEIVPYAPSCDGDTEGVSEEECIDIFLRQEVANENRESVKNLLLASYYDIVDSYPSLFGVSAEALDAQKLNVLFRRTYRDFELEIERRAYTFPCEKSETLVSFNLDGSLFSISRGPITTSEHDALQQREGELARKSQSEGIALSYIREKQPDAHFVKVARSSRSYCPNRGLVIDGIIIATGDSPDDFQLVQVAAENGEVIASSPVASYSYNDAKVKRTVHQSGSYEPGYTSTVVTSNLYTRHASKLEHDFFYVMDANRCVNGSLGSCPACCIPQTQPDCLEDWWAGCSHGPVPYCSGAFLQNSLAYIRSAVRGDRDFSVFSGHSNVEGHVYYWARGYLQWQKDALNRMGLLPASSADYTRTLIVVNPCWHSAMQSDGYFVRTENGHGDGLCRVVLPSNAYPNPYNYSALGTVGAPSPSVIAHELNHFVMTKYLGVPTVPLPCSSGNDNYSFHEGALGSVLPQAHWHALYNVGYSPSDVLKLYQSSGPAGQVHSYSAGLMTRSTHPCSTGPYHAGRVLGQALWKTRHGNDYKRIHLGGGIYTWVHTPIESYSSNTDFVEALYRAARLAKGGSLELYAQWLYVQAIYRFGILQTTSQKCGWCQMFERHGFMSCSC